MQTTIQRMENLTIEPRDPRQECAPESEPEPESAPEPEPEPAPEPVPESQNQAQRRGNGAMPKLLCNLKRLNS